MKVSQWNSEKEGGLFGANVKKNIEEMQAEAASHAPKMHYTLQGRFGPNNSKKMSDHLSHL